MVASGGGIRVDAWMQAIADVTGLPVDRVAVPEGAALDCAWLARMAVGLEQSMDAGEGDFVYIPAGEIHVEENASATEPLVVVLTRNCPGSVVHYLDEA